MRDTKTYDFTDDDTEPAQQREASQRDDVLDGWAAYESWLDMLRKDLDAE